MKWIVLFGVLFLLPGVAIQSIEADDDSCDRDNLYGEYEIFVGDPDDADEDVCYGEIVIYPYDDSSIITGLYAYDVRIKDGDTRLKLVDQGVIVPRNSPCENGWRSVYCDSHGDLDQQESDPDIHLWSDEAKGLQGYLKRK